MTRFRTLPRTRTALIAALTALGVLSAPIAAQALAIQPASVSASPVATPESEPARTATVSITQSAPTIGVDGSLVLSTTIVNSTDTTLPAGRTTLSSGPLPLSSLTQFTGWNDRSIDVRLPLALNSVSVPALAPGESFTTTPVTLTAEQLELHSVYGNYAIRAYYISDSVTTEARSSVLFDPGSGKTTGGLAIVVPITAPPSSTGLIPTTLLAEWTAPGGVLSRQLDAALDRPVTLAIDPMILASIRSLGTAVPESAANWLDRLQHASNASFLLQYADADAALQAQAGAPALLAPISLEYGVDEANFPPAQGSNGTATASPDTPQLPTLEQLTGWPVTESGIVWPGTDTTSAADLSVITASGQQTTLLDGDALSGEEGTTPAAHRTIGGNDVLVADPILTPIFRDLVHPDAEGGIDTDPAHLRAAFAALATEPGAGDRSTLVTLPRGWADTAVNIDAAISLLDSIPETHIVSLATLRAAPSTAATLRDHSVPQDRIDLARTLLEREQTLAKFANALEDPALLTGRERAQILSLLSVGWSSQYSGWDGAVREHNDQTTATLGGITLAPTEQFNMVSWQSNLGFSVRNDLPYPVRVTLEVESDNLRLAIDSSVTREIKPFTTEKFSVPVRARIGNGQSTLSLSLHAPDGTQLGAPSSVRVNVRADWEIIGSVTLGSIVVLLLAGGLFRTVRKRRRLAAAATDSPTQKAPTDG
ncbi:hypothetical protein D9V32_10075 [Mycetocola tolaasinivorans]|uniref:2-oxoglutarate dehydrogenase n=1 Tax=Mycetocola tolaasinivorans TaxID=76635 RepID=A0A3L7A4U6_9MICO|nr:DUF6049 family protein [Mycetocola tolaasinivorans]RLP75237.1 hypothetical protein D9V32_10075 [Mycetocola tolaasinivorans]